MHDADGVYVVSGYARSVVVDESISHKAKRRSVVPGKRTRAIRAGRSKDEIGGGDELAPWRRREDDGHRKINVI